MWKEILEVLGEGLCMILLIAWKIVTWTFKILYALLMIACIQCGGKSYNGLR